MVKIDKFYDDEEKQKRYEKRVKELISETMKKAKRAYSEVYHFGIIKKIARYEIAVYELDKWIQNGHAEDEGAMKEKLSYERELRQLWSNMQIDMKGQRGDNKNEVQDTRDTEKFMIEAMIEAMKENDLEEEEECEEQ